MWNTPEQNIQFVENWIRGRSLQIRILKLNTIKKKLKKLSNEELR